VKWLRARRDEERGAVLVLVAVSMVVLIGSTALAVDIGQLTNTNRDLQAVADSVAMDASRAINGTSVGTLLAPTGAVTVAAQESAARNDFPYAQLEVQLGTKDLVANTPFVQLTNAAAIPNAVRVIARDTLDYAFTPGTKALSRPAVGVQYATAGFSLGSWLVGTTDEQDTVLNTIFGDSFGAHVVSYNGLASANVTLDAIGLAWPTGVLTPDELLTTNVTMSNFLLASATVLRNQGNTAAADVLDAFRLSMTSNSNINLGNPIKTEIGGSAAAASAQMNVLQMLTAMAFIADGTHAINIPAAQLSIPGIGGVTLSLDVISPAKTIFGPVGTSLDTAQVHLTLTPQINVSTSSTVNGCSLTGTLNALLSLSVGELLTCTLGGVVSRVISLDLNASIPVSIEAGGAAATIKAINCASPQSMTLGMEAMPVTLTTNVDLNFTGTLLGSSLGNVMRVRGTGGVTTNSTAADQTFLYPSEFEITRSVGTNGLNATGITNFTATSATLLNANLGPVAATLTTPILTITNSTMVQLNNALVQPLLKLLGLSVGGADLTARGPLQCLGVRLAE
jgi:uncharacterized membrane protein